MKEESRQTETEQSHVPTLNDQTPQTEPGPYQASTLRESSLATFPLAISGGAIAALVMLFAPWATALDPIFGMMTVTADGFDVTSATLEMPLAYPLMGLYAIATGASWAGRLGHLSEGATMGVALGSLAAAAALMIEAWVNLSVYGGADIKMGLWVNAAFAGLFLTWATVHDFFLKSQE